MDVPRVQADRCAYPQPFSYPAYLSPAVSKAIREQGKAYEPIVEGFSSRNAAVIWTINKEEFAKVSDMAVWVKHVLKSSPSDSLQDNNVPLIDEVQRAFLEWQVRDMTKIYSKMYLDDVAQRLFAKDGQGRISDQEIEGIIDDLVSRVDTDRPGDWMAASDTVTRSDRGNFMLKSARINPHHRVLS